MEEAEEEDVEEEEVEPVIREDEVEEEEEEEEDFEEEINDVTHEKVNLRKRSRNSNDSSRQSKRRKVCHC